MTGEPLPPSREPAPPGHPAALPGQPAPLRVQLPVHRPVATYVLLVAISLVFGAQLASQQFLGEDWPLLLGAKVNAAIAQGQYWRLVTPIFLHAGLLHFFFNMYALYQLGRGVEAFLGWLRFVLLFFYAGVAGTVLSMLFSPAPAVGASGAIFGLVAAQGVFFYRHRQIFGERGRRGLQQVVMIAVLNLFIGLQARGIDNWGHVGGLLGGLAVSWALGPRWRVQPSLAAPGQLMVLDEPETTSNRGLIFAGLWVALAAVVLVAIWFAR